MKRWFLLLLLLAVNAAANGACVCVTGILYRYPSGAAICQCARYETPDCIGGQCLFPTECSEYRPRKQTRPEKCPKCRPYRTLTGGPLQPKQTVPSANDRNENVHEQAPGPVQVDGMPVAEDFDPLRAMSVEPQTTASSLGFFRLKIKDKIAINFESSATAPIQKDIEVKLFRMRFPFNQGPRYIAYECRRVSALIKEIEPESISNIRYNPHDGDRILMLKIADKGLRELMGQQVYLLRGPN